MRPKCDKILIGNNNTNGRNVVGVFFCENVAVKINVDLKQKAHVEIGEFMRNERKASTNDNDRKEIKAKRTRHKSNACFEHG